MSHSRFTGAHSFIATAMAASLCAVAQAGPVEMIHSAENALYGAGYEIGKADGWMDKTLRSAIRQYQASHSELKTTGNLDSQTLSALGIAAKDNVIIRDNALSSREAAMSALDIDQQRLSSASPRRPVVSAGEPEPQPEPELNEISRQEPEPDLPTEDSLAPIASEFVLEDGETREPKPDQVDSSETPESLAQTTEPEPLTEPALKPDPDPEPSQAPEPEVAPAEVAAAEAPAPADRSLPDEQLTAAGHPEDSEIPEVPEPAKVSESPEVSDSAEVAGQTARSEAGSTAQSSGGFFASLFDFLFGWLI